MVYGGYSQARQGCVSTAIKAGETAGGREVDMYGKDDVWIAIAAIVLLLAGPFGVSGAAQGRTVTAKSLRCTFPVDATGTWKKDGVPDAAVKPATLVLLFESINTDEGTARLRSGSVGSDLVARLSGTYLHFIQSFRTGPLYTTTVFDQETSGGKLKAVHSRHEYFAVPLPGATSSPEQYYGECEVLN
jgi:hypothetical protein